MEGVQSVQFLLSVKSLDGGTAAEMFDDPEKPEAGRWVYWNPEAVLQVDDQIYYKLTVEYDDLYWDKEGEHTVDKGNLHINGCLGERPADIYFRRLQRFLLTEESKNAGKVRSV